MTCQFSMILTQPTGRGKEQGEVQVEGIYGHIASTHRLELRHMATWNCERVEEIGLMNI